jgi:hypothetical protein
MRVANAMSRLIVWMAMTVVVTSFNNMPFTQGRFCSSLLMSTDAATICPLLPSPAYPAETAEFAMG